MKNSPKIPKTNIQQAAFLKKAMDHCGLSNKKFASELGCTDGAIRHWRSGKQKIGKARRLLGDRVLKDNWPKDSKGYIPLPSPKLTTTTEKQTITLKTIHDQNVEILKLLKGQK